MNESKNRPPTKTNRQTGGPRRKSTRTHHPPTPPTSKTGHTPHTQHANAHLPTHPTPQHKTTNVPSTSIPSSSSSAIPPRGMIDRHPVLLHLNPLQDFLLARSSQLNGPFTHVSIHERTVAAHGLLTIIQAPKLSVGIACSPARCISTDVETNDLKVGWVGGWVGGLGLLTVM